MCMGRDQAPGANNGSNAIPIAVRPSFSRRFLLHLITISVYSCRSRVSAVWIPVTCRVPYGCSGARQVDQRPHPLAVEHHGAIEAQWPSVDGALIWPLAFCRFRLRFSANL